MELIIITVVILLDYGLYGHLFHTAASGVLIEMSSLRSIQMITHRPKRRNGPACSVKPMSGRIILSERPRVGTMVNDRYVE